MTSEGPYAKVGALAAIVAIPVAYLIAAGQAHWWPFPGRERGPAAVSSTPRPSSTTPTKQSPLTPATPASPPVDVVLWKGDLLLNGTAKDLDTAPPSGTTGVDNDINGTSDGIDVWPAAEMSPWPGKNSPSRDECAERIATQAYDKTNEIIPVTVGHTYCYKTSRDRYASLHLLNRATDGYKTRVVVWDLPDS